MEVDQSEQPAAIATDSKYAALSDLQSVLSVWDEERSRTHDFSSEAWLKNICTELDERINHFISEQSGFNGITLENADAWLVLLKKELEKVESESSNISNEIDISMKRCFEDYCKLSSNIEALKFTDVPMQDQEKFADLIRERDCSSLEVLSCENQTDESKRILKMFHDLDSLFKRYSALEEINETLSGLKIHEFDGSCISLSLKTWIPYIEPFQKYKIDGVAQPFMVKHEMLIDVNINRMEILGAEIFPNDVHISDIVESAKCLRPLFEERSLVTPINALEWFLRKVEQRIVLCTLRQTIVKCESKSMRALRYTDKDETVVAHLGGGMDAYIKVPHDWPIISSPLKLASLKSTNRRARDTPSEYLSKVKEALNSMDLCKQQSLPAFVEAIEAQVEQMGSHLFP